MTGACHEHWEDHDHHVCGRQEGHESWHLCVCGAVLFTNTTRDVSPARAVPCPVCLAGVGKPCHTKLLNPMSGVHTERREVYDRTG